MTSTAAEKQFQIRKFETRDRERVRELCCDTGFLGKPIDPVFEDRELFADYLTSYYTDKEPESSFVICVDGQVDGYLLGCRHLKQLKAYELWSNAWIALRGLLRYPRYRESTKKYIKWVLTQAKKEVPEGIEDVPHFHINLLPGARQVSTSRELIEAYLKYLVDCGESAVCGQMVVFEERRGMRMFERYGFRVVNRSEITKFREVHPEPVYLCTVIKDLRENAVLYAKDRPAS